jgi:hypothetical protein
MPGECRYYDAGPALQNTEMFKRKEVGKIVMVSDGNEALFGGCWSFVAPLARYLNIGGLPNDICGQNRKEWKEEAWLETPNRDSHFTMSDDESSDDDYDSDPMKTKFWRWQQTIWPKRTKAFDEAEMGSGDESILRNAQPRRARRLE